MQQDRWLQGHQIAMLLFPCAFILVVPSPSDLGLSHIAVANRVLATTGLKNTSLFLLTDPALYYHHKNMPKRAC